MKWPHIELGRLAMLGPQYGANASAMAPTGGRPRYVRITDITADGRLIETGIAEADLDDYADYVLEDGDLLFARSGATVGKTFRYRSSDGPCLFAGDLIRFRLRPDVADPDYLFYFTQSPTYQRWLQSKKRVAAQPNVNGTEYASLSIPLPALSEQRRIVEILDQADALRQQRADTDAKVQRILPALFHKMFGNPATNPNGWPVEPLEKIARIQGGFAFKSDDFFESGVLLVRIGNLVDGTTIACDNAVFLPREFLDQYSSFRLEDNDLLLALTGATTGKVARFTADFPALLNQRVGRFVPTQDDRAVLDYLHQLMRTNYAQSYIWQFARGFGQPNVAPKQIERMPVPIPPPELVKEFSGRARQAHDIAAQGSKATADIQRLFDVLLYRAFTGELTAKWREAHREQLEREQAEQLRVLQQSSSSAPPPRRERRTRTEVRS